MAPALEIIVRHRPVSRLPHPRKVHSGGHPVVRLPGLSSCPTWQRSILSAANPRLIEERSMAPLYPRKNCELNPAARAHVPCLVVGPQATASVGDQAIVSERRRLPSAPQFPEGSQGYRSLQLVIKLTA